MLIAIPTMGENLKAEVDNRFGRAPNILIYDTEKKSFSVHGNTQNLNATQGAGIQTAQNIVELNANIVFTKNCGPKAFKVLQSAKVKIYQTENNKTIDVLVNDFNNNKLIELTDANVEGHW